MKVRQLLLEKLPQNFNYKKCLIISSILIFFGTLSNFYIGPKIVEIVVKFLFVSKPGHYVRLKHEAKQRFTYKLYLWNVTNPTEVAVGEEKPKLQQVGPYVFSLVKGKVESSDNKYDDTVSFNYLSTFTFNSRLTAPLTGNEVVTLLNAVLASGITKVKFESPHLLSKVTEAFDLLLKNPSSIFITMTAKEFIDNGIQIDCNQTAIIAKVVCAEMRKTGQLNIVNNDKTHLRFRWFDNLNDTLQARYTVMRGSKNIRDVGRITAVNGEPKLKVYKHEEKCNVINGTDSMYFPPFQRKNEILWMYTDAACKSLPIRYRYMKMVRGARTAYKYIYFADPLMNPICECNEYTGCALPGMLDLYACLRVFVRVSAPHFYLAESSIRETLDGMHPRRDLHETGVHFDLQTGVAVLAHERIQVNFLVKRIEEYPIFSSISDDVWIPLLWYEQTFRLAEYDLLLIRLSKILQLIGGFSGYIIMTIGVVGCIVGIVFLLHHNASVKPSESSLDTVSTSNDPGDLGSDTTSSDTSNISKENIETKLDTHNGSDLLTETVLVTTDSLESLTTPEITESTVTVGTPNTSEPEDSIQEPAVISTGSQAHKSEVISVPSAKLRV